jgi:general secretion pathway protein G
MQKNRIERLRRAQSERGMTLIEIMVVLVILGLIAGAIGYNVFGQLKEAQIKTAKLDLQAISNGVDLFHVETGQWPDTLQQLVPKFVREVHKDPWGSEYAFVRAGEGYDVYSYGPDKAQGGGDDIFVHGGEASGSATAQQK